MKKILCFFLILILTPKTSEQIEPSFIIWNVGQGSWSTFVDSRKCLHFDMGGTKFNFQKPLKKNCAQKINILFLTHFDLDHISFIPKAQYNLPRLCLMTPFTPRLNKKKLKWLGSLPKCQLIVPEVSLINKSQFKKYNDSHIYQVLNKILITGDAPRSIEKKVTAQISKNILILLAGHHGSRTSTDSKMLSHLKNLKLAIVSAQKKKYGHPHKEVLDRLQKHKIPCITTEDFDNIHIRIF